MSMQDGSHRIGQCETFGNKTADCENCVMELHFVRYGISRSVIDKTNRGVFQRALVGLVLLYCIDMFLATTNTANEHIH